MRRLAALGPVAAIGLLVAACGSSQGQAQQKITVRSSAFAPGGSIPRAYTCDGRDISPPLRWSGVPDGTTELTLTMQDPDAPGGNFIHWQLSGVSPGASEIGAGQTPAVAVPGTNSFGTTGYRGPCPPRGERAHRYVITITALGDGRALGRGTLTGTYARR